MLGQEKGREDPELEKYLNREYWEQASRAQAKSLVLTQPQQLEQEAVQASPSPPGPGQPQGPDRRAEAEELDDFTMSLRTQLEIFVNRMKSNSSRGRPIATDSSVQTLFMNVMTMHGKLVRYIQEQEEERVMYEGLQDKLSQVKDARAALDALREEEAERKRAELEEAERQRQIQLAAKLEVMRKKKAEYLEYQRQVALQRMADQEREVAKIAEANKAAYMQQQGLYNMYLPYAGHYQQPGMMPQYPGPGMPQYQQYPAQPGMPQTSIPSQQGMPQASMPPQPGMPQSGMPTQPGMPQASMPTQQPGMPPQQPGMPPQQPGIPPQQSGMPPPQPGMPLQQQGMTAQQPGMGHPQGGMAAGQGQYNPSMFPGYYPGPIPGGAQPQDSFNMSGLAGSLPAQAQPYPVPEQAGPGGSGPSYDQSQGGMGGAPVHPQPGAPDQSLISFD